MKKFSLEEFLAHPEKKVVTAKGKEVHLLEYDFRITSRYCPIVGYSDGGENIRYAVSDLFFSDEEPELTEFEWKLAEWMYAGCDIAGMIDGEGESGVVTSTIKHAAKELLELARKELTIQLRKHFEERNAGDTTLEDLLSYKEGFDIGKSEGKAEALKEIEQDAEMEFEPIEDTLEYKAGFRAGKAEALKDLPRWKKTDSPAFFDGITMPINGKLYTKNRYIELSELEKLPGFKED